MVKEDSSVNRPAPKTTATDGVSNLRKGEKPSAPANFSLPKPVKIPTPPSKSDKK